MGNLSFMQYTGIIFKLKGKIPTLLIFVNVSIDNHLHDK